MASITDDVDDEYLADPISLMLIDDIKKECDEDQIIDINSSSDEEEVYTSAYGKKNFVLPVTFFDNTRNIRLLNKCKPMSINIVDCKQYPTYYCKNEEKSISKSDESSVEIDNKDKSDVENKPKNADGLKQKNTGLVGLKITHTVFKQIVYTEKTMIIMKKVQAENKCKESNENDQNMSKTNLTKETNQVNTLSRDSPNHAQPNQGQPIQRPQYQPMLNGSTPMRFRPPSPYPPPLSYPSPPPNYSSPPSHLGQIRPNQTCIPPSRMRGFAMGLHNLLFPGPSPPGCTPPLPIPPIQMYLRPPTPQINNDSFIGYNANGDPIKNKNGTQKHTPSKTKCRANIKKRGIKNKKKNTH